MDLFSGLFANCQGLPGVARRSPILLRERGGRGGPP